MSAKPNHSEMEIAFCVKLIRDHLTTILYHNARQGDKLLELSDNPEVIYHELIDSRAKIKLMEDMGYGFVKCHQCQCWMIDVHPCPECGGVR